jgi:divalent metal cation (Fe/Co/Zn/Cd) transporter
MHVTVDSQMTVKEASEIAFQIEGQTKRVFRDIIEMNVIVEPAREKEKTILA